jgi:hypothetical protein
MEIKYRSVLREYLLVICTLTLSTDFVGYDSSLDTIIVSRQGNDNQLYVDRNVISASIEALDANKRTTSLSDLNNAQTSFTSLDPKIFSNITNAAQVYKGFAAVQAQCDLVLSPYAHPLLIPIAIALLRVPQDRARCTPDRVQLAPNLPRYECDDCRAFRRRRTRPARWCFPPNATRPYHRCPNSHVRHAPGW